MGNFDIRVKRFIDVFINAGAYNKVLLGLKKYYYNSCIGSCYRYTYRYSYSHNQSFAEIQKTASYFSKRAFSSFYVSLFQRNRRVVVQLLVFYYVLLPLLNIKMTSVAVSVCVFGLNSAAYVSEIMRSGIQSVDPGQMEGGRAVGMSYGTTMMKIIIPQAIKSILPTLGNEFISLIKETSVVSFVGATDLYVAFNYIGSNSYEFMVPYLVMAIIYILMVLIISFFIKIMERSLKKSDRSH